MGDGKLLQANGVDEISSFDFGEVIVGTPVPKKFAFFNDKGRIATPDVSVVEQDGNDMDDYMGFVIGTVTLSCPYGVAVTLVSTITSLTVGSTYGYVMTALSTLGETGPCDAENIVIVGADTTPKIEWTAISSSSGYRIYRKISTASTWTDKLIAVITSPGQTSYIDLGIPNTTGSVPSANTTAGSSPGYGTGPSSGYASTLDLGNVADGQQVFFWGKVDPGVSVSENDNPRICAMRIQE